MRTRTKIFTLDLLGGVFGFVWIAAFVAAVYFLHEALANGAPWSGLSWSLVTGVISKQIAAAFRVNKQRVEYVGHLTERGYAKAAAEAAWRTASGGGRNLLRNLQQAEIGDESARFESATGAVSSESSGDSRSQ